MFDFLLRPIRRNFGPNKTYYRIVDDMFGFIPHNVELYKLALVHRSASFVLDDGRTINNERLEFLGDAIIEAVTSDYLFIEYPEGDEGFMTQLRSKMVSRQSLNELAVALGLDRYIILNGTIGTAQKHVHGDAFEAIIGAVYLDQGYEFVNRLLINRIYAAHLSMDELTELETDFKSRLIEWCQKNHHRIDFRTGTERTGRRGDQFFRATVFIDNFQMGYGIGDSKKQAEQRAALSVADNMSDEQCARLLDQLDRMVGEAPAGPVPAEKAAAPKTEGAAKTKPAAKRKPSPKVASSAPAEKAAPKTKPAAKPKPTPKATAAKSEKSPKPNAAPTPTNETDLR